MSLQAKRRSLGAMFALALLVLLAGFGLSGRPNSGSSSATTSTAAHRQAAAPSTGNSALPASASLASQQANTAWPQHSTVIHSLHNDTSPPLRSMKVIPPSAGRVENERENGRHGTVGSSDTQTKDPVVQSSFGPLSMPTPLMTFEGINNRNGVLPPDNNGDVGPNNYVEWINLSFQIFDKSGNSLFGPANGNTLFTGFNSECAGTNDGDPITLYDPIANRWLMSQFAQPNWPSGPFYQCVAVSATADPLGAWNRYSFQTSATKLNDYPHFGVWPDAYYMSANLFTPPSFAWAGTGIYAMDRTRMLAGQAATMQMFELPLSDWGGILPSDLDGSTLPPAGAPNTYIEVNDAAWDPPNTPADELQFHQFHVDWTTPSNTTFSPTVHVAVAPFDGIACANFDTNCIPQQGSSVKLDAITDRTMYRLAYRNFGDHESLVLNHTVDVNGTDNGYTGVRWYEIRNPRANPPTIYQQGTYAPDSNSRWMGSAAMDRSGNMAIGFSISSASMYASIAYAGRLATDPLNTLAQGEAMMYAGTGAQTHSANRWGDYTMLSVDPTDDCTFWYVNEYIQTTGSAPWHTRIGKFKFPTCGQAPPTPTATVTPCALPFVDVLPTDYFYEAVRYLYCEGAISGYGTYFLPNNLTTRGQLTKIVALAEGFTAYTPPSPTFQDVPATHPFYQYVETVYHEGIISGYGCGTGCLEFRPGNNVTRAQLSKIVVNAEGWALQNPSTPTFQDVPSTDTFYQFIETAYAHSVISGYSCGTGCLEFRPNNSATRGQISKIVYLAVTAP